jgi:CheY-like chemotaxis protein
MGGSIAMQSHAGQGTRVAFTVPLELSPEPAASPAPVSDLSGLHVLIVDDNEVNRRVVHEQITSWGMRNGSFSTGEMALDALRAAYAAGDPYHFVIADFQMPVMDGAVLAAAIKADPILRDTLVVMLTSIGDWREVRGMQGRVVDACMVKPVRQSQLFNAMAGAWAARLHAMPAAIGRAEPSARSEPGFEGSHLRVLVAEDNVVNQKVAARMLESKGIRVDVAGNGREAVEMMCMLHYDVIFMDCQMPELNGFEATAEIRRREAAGRHVAIIAMTATAMAGCRERCLAAGMDDFIPKPVKMEVLLEALKKWGSVRTVESI